MRGPITVFDEGIFAGDARIDDVAPASSQLISYAVDLGTNVRVSTEQTEPSTQIHIAHGQLVTVETVQRITSYAIDHSAAADRDMIIEQPIDTAWKLLPNSAFAEKTATLYRFRAALPAAKSVTLDIREEQSSTKKADLEKLGDKDIQQSLAGGHVSGEVKKVLQEVATKRQQVSAAVTQLELSTAATRDIMTDQQRVRENLKALDQTDELYKVYVKRMSDQENELAKLRDRVAQHRAARTQAESALHAYLKQLTGVVVQ